MTYETDRSTTEDQPKVRGTSLARTLARACVLRLIRPILISNIITPGFSSLKNMPGTVLRSVV